MDQGEGRQGRRKLSASERRANAEENKRKLEKKKRKLGEEKHKLGEASKPKGKKLTIKLRTDSEKSVNEGPKENPEKSPTPPIAEKQPTIIENETDFDKEADEPELTSTPREPTPISHQPTLPGDFQSCEESSSPTPSPNLNENPNSSPNLNKNSPNRTPLRVSEGEESLCTPPTERVSPHILGRMPTPREREPDLEKRVGSEDERRIREELMRGRPTTGGKRLADLTPPQNWEGPSGAGGQEDLVSEDEEIVDEDMEELIEEEKAAANDKHWRLLEGCEGGPSNPELLRGFVAHVSYEIWNGKERDVLKGILSYERGITKWIKDLYLLPEVAAWVEKSGVLCLNELMYRKINMPLVSAFVERWQPETNTFHFPFGELTILLHDVAYTKDLPIVGKLAADKLTVPTLKKKFAALLAVTPGLVSENWKIGCVRFGYVCEKCPRGRGNPEKVAKLYVMWLLSSTLFPDKTKSGIIADLIGCCEKLEDVMGYDWGAALLVNLYRQLGVASRATCKEMAGCLSMLQAWIYAYFPCFRPKERKDWVEGMPWAKKWENKHTKYPEDALITYRRKLDGLTVDDVEWTPFNPNPTQVHKISLFRGILQFRHITEPYMPDRVLRQFGYVQTIPVDPFIPSVKELRWKPNSYKIEFNEEADEYEAFDSHCVSLDGRRPISRKGECADDYMEWFVERTHVRVNPVMPSSPRSYELEAAEAQLESIVDLFYDAHPSIRPDDVEPHPYVELVDKLCLQVLGTRFDARGLRRGHGKGEGKRKRGD